MTSIKKTFSDLGLWLQDTQSKIFDLFFLLPYAALIGFGIWYHEPWSDEALPWMIARDASASEFIKIIFENWDRHPGLLHAILIPFVKLGLPFFSQSILNLSFSLLAAALFLTYAPFSRIFRILFLFSYYMLYEYSVIVRPYMLTILLLFTIAAFYGRRVKSPLIYSALVALLFHSDYMGFGLGVGLTIGFFLENQKLFRTQPRLAAAFALMALNAILIFWMAHALPPGHGEYGLHMPFRFSNILNPIANAFFPFSSLGRYPFLTYPVALISGIATIFLAFIALLSKRIPMIILGSGLGFLFIVFAFFQGGDYRNHGFILISIVFALWIARAFYKEEESRLISEKWQKFSQQANRTAFWLPGLCLLLGFQNIIYVYQLDYFLPFSGARPMAEAIQKIESNYHLLEKGYVIVAPHKNSVGLQPYLPGVKFWNPCAAGYVDYFKSTQAMRVCNDLPEAQALQITKNYFPNLSKVILLLRQRLPVLEDEEYMYREVFGAPKVFGYWYETFFLYQATPKPKLLSSENQPRIT